MFLHLAANTKSKCHLTSLHFTSGINAYVNVYFIEIVLTTGKSISVDLFNFKDLTVQPLINKLSPATLNYPTYTVRNCKVIRFSHILPSIINSILSYG